MFHKVAAIYDIHANILALDAVLNDIDNYGIDCIVIGGDVAWGPEPAQVMERLMTLNKPAYFVRGNTDREIVEKYGVEYAKTSWVDDVNHWCHDQLSQSQLNFLRMFPEQVMLKIKGLGDVLFVHGSPRDDDESIRKTTPEEEIVPMVEGVKENTIVCGHTHIQFDRLATGKRIVNAGSVGLQSCSNSACWAVLGPDIMLYETTYDSLKAAERARKSGIPMSNEFANHLLDPPMEAPWPEGDTHSLFVPGKNSRR